MKFAQVLLFFINFKWHWDFLSSHVCVSVRACIVGTDPMTQVVGSDVGSQELLSFLL